MGFLPSLSQPKAKSKKGKIPSSSPHARAEPFPTARASSPPPPPFLSPRLLRPRTYLLPHWAVLFPPPSGSGLLEPLPLFPAAARAAAVGAPPRPPVATASAATAASYSKRCCLELPLCLRSATTPQVLPSYSPQVRPPPPSPMAPPSLPFPFSLGQGKLRLLSPLSSLLEPPRAASDPPTTALEQIRRLQQI